MRSKRKVKIFVGYQIESGYHEVDKIKEAINKVKGKVEIEENVDIGIQYGEFPAGRFLFSEVFNAIRNCEIAIFDISENNANVLIEVGIAYGNNRYVILLKNELSKEGHKVPSDIGAFIYVPYEDNDAISIDDTCNQIADAILNYLKRISKPVLYFNSLWGFNENDSVYIICPEAPEPEKKQEPEPEEFLYLGKYGDIDSLVVVLISLSRLYPQLNVKICTGEEFDKFPGNPYADNLILIGGPDYNKITRVFMKNTPFEFAEENGVTILKDRFRDQPFRSQFIEHDGIEKVIDFGFFLKILNPNNPNKKLIMINGIHTYGVYGAAKCFSQYDEHEMDISYRNCKEVISEFGDDPTFAVMLEVKSINKKIGIPEIKREDLISL